MLSLAKHRSEDAMNDRHRLYGFTVCFVGIPITLFTMVLIRMLGDESYYVLVSGSFGITVLTLVGICCYFNFAVERVLSFALLATFANVWGFGALEFYAQDYKQHQLAIMLFIPLLIVSLMKHRMIFMLIPIQFGLAYYASTSYAHVFFSDAFTDHNIIVLGVLFASMSCVVLFMSGITALIRDRNDEKFLKVIEENRLLSMTDPLTGLKNRRALGEVLEAYWEEGRSFTLAFMDLDRFKPINDQFGHAAGDTLLRELAERLSTTKAIDCAARVGGDEFAFILADGVSADDIDLTIRAIHTAVMEDIALETGKLNVGASIGYVERDDQLTSVSLMLAAAETSMRRAKQTKIGWARYDHALDDATMATAAIEVAFRRALKSGKIRAALQPIACAKTLETKGYELLARWVDSGLSSDPRPDQFIPIAEKLGLLNELLAVTLNEALGSGVIGSKFLSINISPAQILAADFNKTILGLLEAHNFLPERLILEITEDVAFRNLGQNIGVLEDARRQGIRIALDDFGKGYSSLSIVEKLPLDKIKIDRSLVYEIDRNRRMASLLEVALQMATKLDLECCVEGVETETIARRLQRLGVDEIQGYWLAEPKLAAEISKLDLVA